MATKQRKNEKLRHKLLFSADNLTTHRIFFRTARIYLNNNNNKNRTENVKIIRCTADVCRLFVFDGNGDAPKTTTTIRPRPTESRFSFIFALGGRAQKKGNYCLRDLRVLIPARIAGFILTFQ